MCKQKRVKKLVYVLFMMNVSHLSGCYFNNYFRDYSKDYVNAKEGPPLIIPKNLNTESFENNILIPTVTVHHPKSLQPNEIPPPMYTVTNMNGSHYKMVDTPHGVVIESNADRNMLWNRLLDFLQSKKINIMSENKAQGSIESNWITPSTKDKQGIIAKTTNLFTKHEKDHQTPFKLLFSLKHVAKKNSWQIMVDLQHTTATQKGIQRQPANTDAAIVDDARQDLFVFLIKQNEILMKQQNEPPTQHENKKALDAKAITLLTMDDNGQPILKIKSDFNTAWSSIEESLKKANISIKEANYKAGIYYIYLLNTDKINFEEDKTDAFYTRLFGIKGSNKIQQAPVYRLVLSPADKDIYVYLEKNTEIRAPIKLSEVVLDKIWNQL